MGTATWTLPTNPYTITAPSGVQPDVGPEAMQFYPPNRLDYTWIDTRRQKGCQYKNYAQIGIQAGADVIIQSETGTGCYQYTGHPGRRWIFNGKSAGVPEVPASPDLVALGPIDGVAPNVLLTNNNYCGGDGVIQLCSPGLTTDPVWGGEQDCTKMVSYNDTVSTISGVGALVGTGSDPGPFLSTITQIAYVNLNGTVGTSGLSAHSSSGVNIGPVLFHGGALDASSDVTGSPTVIVEATPGCSGCSVHDVTVKYGTISNALTTDVRVGSGALNTIVQFETLGATRTSTGTNMITRGDTNTQALSNTMTAASNGNCGTFGTNGFITTSLTLTGNTCTGVTNTNDAFVINNVNGGVASFNSGSAAAGQMTDKGLTTASVGGSDPGTTNFAVNSNDMHLFDKPFSCNPSTGISNTSDGLNVGGSGVTACNTSPF